LLVVVVAVVVAVVAVVVVEGVVAVAGSNPWGQFWFSSPFVCIGSLSLSVFLDCWGEGVVVVVVVVLVLVLVLVVVVMRSECS
jgi:hypothetical protein